MAAIIGIFILPIVLLARHKNLTGIDTQTINTKHSINTMHCINSCFCLLAAIFFLNGRQSDYIHCIHS